ncbi:MAG TPA: LysE family translocator [Caulobacteraceae bacterium]
MSPPVDPARYAAFLSVLAVMAATPGPANLFAIATGLQKGRGGALLGVAGMNTGTLVWFAGAAAGLGALVVAFPKAFHLLAITGALYVAWLGVKAMTAGVAHPADPAKVTVRRERSAFVDGLAVQLSNPKALLFFTAVLPPFIDVQRPLIAQLAMFAAATIGLDVIAMSAYGLSGAALSRRMSEPRFRRGFSIVVGVLLIAAAVLILTRAL